MSTNWRQRVAREHRSETAEWFEDLTEAEPLSESQFDAQRWANRLESARAYDPDSSLVEELALRLIGEEASGGLRFDIGSALMKPLQDGITANNLRVSLELTGISEGSTVLHVKPRIAQVDADHEPGLVTVDDSPADAAIRELIDLVDTAETHGDIRRWTNMLGSLDSLVAVLDRFNLDMDLGWCSRNGSIRMSSLTATGRAYVRGLRETSSDTAIRSITGRITELKSSGLIKVKTGSARNSSAYEIRVDSNQLMEMHLELGMNVTFEVREERKADRVGRIRDHEYHFVSHINQPMIDESDPS